MISLEQQERAVFLNSQYQDNSELIQRLGETLLHDIHTLDLAKKDLLDTKQYIKDKVTLFRFLRECKFDFNKAHERLLKTISWRIEQGIADLTFDSSIEFFDKTKGPLAHFLMTDKFNRPLIFVKLRFFPREFRDPTKKLLHHIQRYACLMMEIGRKLTWDMTREREIKGEPCALVSQMTTVVNLKNAPIIALDGEIVKTMGIILEEKFPGMVYKVNIINASWYHLAAWTAIKIFLSEQAKEIVNFTNPNDLKLVIDEDLILEEMGGNNRFQWSIESDQVLQKYGTGLQPELPDTPPQELSRASSISEDEFFDADDTLPIIPLPPPMPEESLQSTIRNIMATKTSLTSPTSLPGTLNHQTNSYYGNMSSWAGLRMGVDFLTSFIDTQKGGHHQRQKKIKASIENIHQNDTPPIPEPPSSIIVVNPSQIQHENMPMTHFKHIQMYFQSMAQYVSRVSFGQQRGMVYWVLLYLFLRGPIESVVRKTVARTSWIESSRITTTTLGITAAVAALISASISDKIAKYRRL